MTDGHESERLDEARDFVLRHTDRVPRVALQLGSGLGSLVTAVQNDVAVPYGDIPHLPACAVEGHDGKLVLGTLAGVPVCLLAGRFHLYEGHDPAVVARPVRLARRLGADVLLVTNAAGGLREDLAPGTLMILEDHLNLTGRSPLTGANDDALGLRFPDMSQAYDPDLGDALARHAEALGFHLPRGVYACLPGPQYETPAEIRMLAALGADAVGMSTVLEVIAAVHAGLRVAGLSCITNQAAGLAPGALSHDEVVEVTAQASGRLMQLMLSALPELAP